MTATSPVDLPTVARNLRKILKRKRLILLYGHNGTGKTRLSTEFKNIGKKVDADGETVERDTLYFNAFTEDLFSWDNDLVEDLQPRLLVNPYSSLISAFGDLEFSDRIEGHFRRYCTAKFEIIRYSPEEVAAMAVPESPFHHLYRRYGNEMEIRPKHIQFKTHDGGDCIKICRGEERVFIWSVFLAIIQQVIKGAAPYRWVKYIYIDDPISSLDEHNAIKVAHDLTHLLSTSGDHLRTVISTHHVLFYDVVGRRFGSKASKHFLTKGAKPETYLLEDLENAPPFHHLSTLFDLCQARDSAKLDSHHFNMLRRVLEQTASFFGHESWVECLSPRDGESERAFQKRIVDLNSHGDWVIFESPMINDSMRSDFRTIFEEFRRSFPFNPKWCPPAPTVSPTPASAPVTPQ